MNKNTELKITFIWDGKIPYKSFEDLIRRKYYEIQQICHGDTELWIYDEKGVNLGSERIAFENTDTKEIIRGDSEIERIEITIKPTVIKEEERNRCDDD